MEKELELRLKPHETLSHDCLKKRIASACRLKVQDLAYFRILRRSIDSRGEPRFCLRVFASTEKKKEEVKAKIYHDVSSVKTEQKQFFMSGSRANCKKISSFVI